MSPETELRQRLELASSKVDQGQDDEALEELAWLWEHSLEVSEAWVGVRSSYLMQAVRPLIERSEAARERFARFRDRAGSNMEDRSHFGDWVTLNCLLGQEQRVLQWLATATETEALAVGVHRNHQVLELLEHHSEWATLGRLLRDPAELLKDEYGQVTATLSQMPTWITPEQADETRTALEAILRKRAAAFYHSMTAANRLLDAQVLFDEAMRLDPSAEMRSGLEQVRGRRAR